MKNLKSEVKDDADEVMSVADAPDLALAGQPLPASVDQDESKDDAVASPFKKEAGIVNNELTDKNAVSIQSGGDNIANENTENLKRSIEEEDQEKLIARITEEVGQERLRKQALVVRGPETVSDAVESNQL